MKQREIKFRAWEKEIKKMFYDIQDYYDTLGYNFDAGAMCDNNCVFGDLIKDKRLEIMQYTGLKDKNGKEIYEGDIIKYKTAYYGNEKEHQEVVEWKNDLGCDSFGEPLGIGYLFRGFDIEVVGNKFENPEILKN